MAQTANRHGASAANTFEQISSWHFHASGFNGYGQLDEDSDLDLYAFRRLSPSSNPAWLRESEILFLGWSETIFTCPNYKSDGNSMANRDSDRALLCSGGIRKNNRQNLIQFSHPSKDLLGGFGDHNGLLGALNSNGEVFFMRPRERSSNGVLLLEQKSTDGSPRLAQLAMAGNGRVAIAFVQAPNARLTHICEYDSFSGFASWYVHPSASAHYPSRHHMIPGKLKQLVSNATTFTCLMEAGEVYTWGDARHRSLGRNTVGEDSVAADKAGLLEALAGVKISKVSGGGWITAAISADGAAYLWGATTPGTDTSIRGINGLGETEVALVEIAGPDGEPLDVLDVAVGAGHVVVLVETGRVFVCGENANGQLGLGSRKGFYEDWTEVNPTVGSQCLAVFAGPKYTLLKMQSSTNQSH